MVQIYFTVQWGCGAAQPPPHPTKGAKLSNTPRLPCDCVQHNYSPPIRLSTTWRIRWWICVAQ